MEPAELEAMNVPEVKLEWAGETYTVAGSIEETDGDVIDAIDDKAMSHALRGLLGEEQWVTFKSHKPKTGEYGDVINLWLAEIGLGDVGNSSGS